MGNDPPKPIPKRDPAEEIQEAILNMRMTAKQFEHSAKRAERDQKKRNGKGQDCIKKE